MSPAAADSLRLGLETPDSVPAGQPVPMTFRIENTSSRTVTLYLLGRTIAFDVIVRGSGGEVVWRRLEGETIPQILRVEMVAPGESLVLESTWDQRSNAGERVRPGTYSVVAELFTEGEPLRSPAASLRILDR